MKWNRWPGVKIPTADHTATIMKESSSESQCRGFQITGGLYLYMFIYIYTYHIYIYIYIIYIWYIYIYIMYICTLYIHHIHIISYHIISYIYIHHIHYINILWHPVQSTKTSNLNFQHVLSSSFSAHHTRSSQAAPVGESPVPNIWVSPAGKMEKHPTSPKKTCGNLKVYQENSTKSSLIRNLRFLLFCQTHSK